MLGHVEEVSGNVAATCRYYGISRQCSYSWLRRYEADGLEGLKARSSRPHHSPQLLDDLNGLVTGKSPDGEPPRSARCPRRQVTRADHGLPAHAQDACSCQRLFDERPA